MFCFYSHCLITHLPHYIALIDSQYIVLFQCNVYVCAKNFCANKLHPFGSIPFGPLLNTLGLICNLYQQLL